MRELTVDIFSTVDGYGSSSPDTPVLGGPVRQARSKWIHGQLAEDQIMLMGAT